MRRVARGFVALVAVLGVLVAAAAFLTMTPAGFRWLAGAAGTLSGNRLMLRGVDGDLAGKLAIDTLTVVTDTRRIEVQGLRFEWQPHALLRGWIDVDLLAATTLRVTALKKDLAPAVEPRSLRLPFSTRVRVIDLQQLEVVDAGQTLAFRTLRGELDDTGDRYRLSRASVITPWAELQGQLELGKDAPFVLEGRIDAARTGEIPLRARLGLTGSLRALQFSADAHGGAMRFMASGEAAPFAAVRLRTLLVAGQGIDPRRFAADAPAADLAFSGIFEGRPGERVVGTFSLSNAQAGRLDQHLLPLANVTGAVLGDATRADFSALLIDLGHAGQLSGTGLWRDGRFQVDLASQQLNLAGLHRAFHATRLRTTLQLAGDATRQTLAAVLRESWGEGRVMLSRDATALRLESAEFSGEAGRLTAKGTLQWDASRAFAATFDAREINPARLGAFPRASLNARGEVTGALVPDLSLGTRFTLPPGLLEGRPVRGQGTLHYAKRHLTAADIDVDLAGNRAVLKGAYGRPGDRLVWNIDAPALARLNLGMAGRLNSSGSVSGDPGRPQVSGKLTASELRLPGGLAADRVNLQLDLEAAADGAFTGQLDAREVSVAGQRVVAARAELQGRRHAHTLVLDAQLPAGRLLASLAGGLDKQTVWRGQLTRAEVQGAWPARLIAPADLVLGRDSQQVERLALTLAGGQLRIDQFSRQGARLASRGSLDSLPLAPLLDGLGGKWPFSTDLRIQGDWNLRAGDTLDGQVRLRRQTGDVRLKEPAVALGLTALTLDFDAAAGRVDARLTADSRDAGHVRATGQAALVREGAAFAVARNAPLVWAAQFDVPDLRLVKPLMPVGVRADARLAAQLRGSGSLAAPRIDGQMAADSIRFAMPDEGVAISDGSLKLVLDGDRVRVQEGALVGTSGRVVVSGEAQWRNPQAGLTLTFEKFAALNRSDRKVIVSGAAQLNLDPKRLELTGTLTADRARIEMPEASRPELSSDVVIVGRPPRPQPVSQRLPLALDLRLDLGKDFLFKGAGLDARLGGQLHVFTVDKAVRGEGTIQVEKGRYAAYAQTLDIERGVLRFVGPIDNPGLDVLAVRKTATVKAGVQVGGTVQRPVVKLYSDPPLPDTEKLAWLVLGHGLENSGQQEFMLMQVAAGALLSQAESVNLQAKLADTLGIDTFDVRAGSGADLTSTVVSVGKRLSSRATLSYEQSIDGLSQVVKVLYQLTERVRLEAQAGQPSSFDILYTRDYD